MGKKSRTFKVCTLRFSHTHTHTLSRTLIHTHTAAQLVMTWNFSYRIFFLLLVSLAIRLCVSFALVRYAFYVGHPMKTVLFLALDRPAVSALTYQSSYSGKTHTTHSSSSSSSFLFIFHHHHHRNTDTYFIARAYALTFAHNTYLPHYLETSTKHMSSNIIKANRNERKTKTCVT